MNKGLFLSPDALSVHGVMLMITPWSSSGHPHPVCWHQRSHPWCTLLQLHLRQVPCTFSICSPKKREIVGLTVYLFIPGWLQTVAFRKKKYKIELLSVENLTSFFPKPTAQPRGSSLELNISVMWMYMKFWSNLTGSASYVILLDLNSAFT